MLRFILSFIIPFKSNELQTMNIFKNTNKFYQDTKLFVKKVTFSSILC